MTLEQQGPEFDECCGVGFKRMAERVVGRQEEPALPTLFDDCVRRTLSKGICVVHPVHSVGGAGLPSELRSCRDRRNGDLVLLRRQLLHGEGDSGVSEPKDRVDLLDIGLMCTENLNTGVVVVKSAQDGA
jgi:hypothetical protein